MISHPAGIPTDSASSTAVAILRWRGLNQPDRRAYSFLADGETHEECVTYGALDRQARAIGAQLQSLAGPGERVLLLLPPGLDYLAALFGGLYAGLVGVPAPAPHPDHGAPALRDLAQAFQPAVALTTAPLLPVVEHALAPS